MENQVQDSVNKTYPGIGQTFALLGVFIVCALIFALPVELMKTGVSEITGSLFSLIGYIFPMVLVLLFCIRKRKNWHFLFRKVPIYVYLLIIPICLSYIIIIEPLAFLIPMPDFIQEVFQEMCAANIYSFLMIVIAAPVLEELLFRGVILDGLLKNYSPFRAILFSSLIFGLAHLNPWQFVETFFAGLIIGWIYFETNSLLPCIFIHVFANLMGYILANLFSDNISESTRQLMNSDFIYGIIYIFSVLILITGLVFVGRMFKTHPTPKAAEIESAEII